MQFLVFILLSSTVMTGPPPWIGFDVSQTLSHRLAQKPPPATLPATCNHNKKDGTPWGPKPPCISHIVLERSLRAAGVARLQIGGPEVQCDRGGVCSVSVGSRLQVEASLPSASLPLGLSLSLCSLSPSSDPFNNSNIPLLVGGCPVEVGVSLQVIPPSPCTREFPTRSFSFQLGPYYNNSIQFLHCQIELCLEDSVLCHGLKRIGASTILKCPMFDDSCVSFSPPPPFPRSPFVRTVTQPLMVTISPSSRSILHPRIGHRNSRLPPSNARIELGPQGVGMEAVVGVTVCSFVIGVMLIAGLWYIQSKTAPVSSVTNGGSPGPSAF